MRRSTESDDPTGGEPTRGSAEMEQVRRLAHLLDEAVEIPILRVRVGLDSLLGLIPGVGDLAGAAAGGWIVFTAVRLGAPAWIVARMLLNLGVDALVGAVPLLGDLFDVGFKANRRNVRLVERHVEDPEPTRRRSRLVLLGTAAGLVAILVLVAVLAWWLLTVLLAAFF